MTPPYDKIPGDMAERLYKKDVNNIHLVLGKQNDSDTDQDNRYTRAKTCLNSWIQNEYLLQSSQPCFYLYRQMFRYHEARSRVRRGFVCLLKLVELDQGIVLPHEFTLSKPKEDRLNLIRETQANLGQIFMLYEDETLTIDNIFDAIETSAPLLQAKDEQGEEHAIWEISDANTIKMIQDVVKKRPCLIADGHHRYETSWTYCQEKKGTADAEGADYIMVTLVNMCQKDLLVLPTHRLIKNVDTSCDVLLQKLSKHFDIAKTVPMSEKDIVTQADVFLKDARGQYRFVAMSAQNNQAVFLMLKPGIDPKQVLTMERSEAWKKLDVVLLHELILRDIFAIDEKKLRDGNHVGYVRDIDEGVRALKEKTYQHLFLVNPTPPQEVVTVAQAGDRMPQKSTDFYPKLFSGLVIRKM